MRARTQDADAAARGESPPTVSSCGGWGGGQCSRPLRAPLTRMPRASGDCAREHRAKVRSVQGHRRVRRALGISSPPPRCVACAVTRARRPTQVQLDRELAPVPGGHALAVRVPLSRRRVRSAAAPRVAVPAARVFLAVWCSLCGSRKCIPVRVCDPSRAQLHGQRPAAGGAQWRCAFPVLFGGARFPNGFAPCVQVGGLRLELHHGLGEVRVLLRDVM